MKGSKIGMWKEKSNQIQETFDVHVKTHEAKWNQWATKKTQLEEKVVEKTEKVEKHGHQVEKIYEDLWETSAKVLELEERSMVEVTKVTQLKGNMEHANARKIYV